MINIDDVRRILEMAREHELSELEVESEGFRIRIRKDSGGVAHVTTMPAVQPLAAATAAPASAAPAPLTAAPPEIEPDMELAVVTSPIVGTFYRAPEPSAAPFVQPGDIVRQGQTLCIIEAMKMMNNIDSEYEGTIVKVYVENGQPVQYGERLFAIKTR